MRTFLGMLAIFVSIIATIAHTNRANATEAEGDAAALVAHDLVGVVATFQMPAPKLPTLQGFAYVTGQNSKQLILTYCTMAYY